MATKKNTAPAEESEKTAEEPAESASAGSEGGDSVQPGGETGESKEETSTDEKAGETVKRVYIGPSIPFGKLREAMILEGTEEELKAFVSDLAEEYPEIPCLLVAPEELTEAMEKVGKKGTILHKYYSDMLAKSHASRNGHG